MTDQMRFLDLEMVHHRQQIICHLIDGIVDTGAAALARSSMIVKDYLVLLRECGDVWIPIAADATEPGDQHNGSSCPVCLEIDIA
jgi:hypothetical protein